MRVTGSGGRERAGAPYGGRRWARAVAPAVCALVTVAVLAGCSSSSGAKDSGAPGIDLAPDSHSPAASAHRGGHTGRPADACGMLTSDQVAKVVGTPGPYTGAEEDAADDGSPVWGCTWGTQDSYADVREIGQVRFTRNTSGPGPDDVLTPLGGIGDKAVLEKDKSDGGNPYVYFVAGGAYYEAEVVVDRRESGTENAPREAVAEQELAKMLAGELAG